MRRCVELTSSGTAVLLEPRGGGGWRGRVGG